MFYSDCFRYVTLSAIQTSLPLTTTEALSLLEYTCMSNKPSLEREAIIMYISGASACEARQRSIIGKENW